MPVAGDDLGGDVLALQAEPLHHPGLDRGGHRGVGPDRARELAVGELLEGVLEPLQVAVGLEGEPGEPEPEGRRLGVDAVGAADAEGVALLDRPLDQGIAVGAGAGEQDRSRLLELQREGGVEDVGGGEAVVDPAAVLADRCGDDVDEGGDVVVGDLLALVDGLDGERGVLAAGARRLLGDDPLLRPGLRRRQLDLEPALELALLGPDLPDLGAGVAGDHRLPSQAVARAIGSPIARRIRGSSLDGRPNAPPDRSADRRRAARTGGPQLAGAWRCGCHVSILRNSRECGLGMDTRSGLRISTR